MFKLFKHKPEIKFENICRGIENINIYYGYYEQHISVDIDVRRNMNDKFKEIGMYRIDDYYYIKNNFVFHTSINDIYVTKNTNIDFLKGIIKRKLYVGTDLGDISKEILRIYTKEEWIDSHWKENINGVLLEINPIVMNALEDRRIKRIEFYEDIEKRKKEHMSSFK